MKSCTVLVVEDDSSIRRGLVDALHYAGYGVIECDNGNAAATMAIESDIDLALLDVMLPGRDGFSILEEVRAS
jgi:DNA-binding response OmpR family regulator